VAARFDNDGSLDNAAPVTRLRDGKRGIAICRAGAWLHLLWLTDRIGEELVPAYFESIDWWRVNPPVSLENGVAWPELNNRHGRFILGRYYLGRGGIFLRMAGGLRR